MVTLEDLMQAYMVTRRNKRRSADSVEFELHWEARVLELLDTINNRRIAPTAYTFVTTKPRPREVFACDMSTRIIHHYIDMRMRPLLEKRMTGRTYNNRVGFGQNVAINQVIEDIYEVSQGYTHDAWIIKIDLQGYFPNADQHRVYEQLTGVIKEDYQGPDKEDLLYMIERSIFSYPQDHCWRKSPMWKWSLIPDEKSLFRKPYGIGGAIGHLIWQNAMNYYLNDFDRWVVDELQLHYCRFVDDMVFVTDNKKAFLAMMPEIRRRLESFGCKVHPRKFYCQHYSKGVEFIGSHIKMNRVYVNHRVVHNARAAIRNFNRCPRVGKMDQFLSSINSYLGICKTRNGYAILRDLVDMINPKWWQFVHYNDRRQCLEPNNGYRLPERLRKTYNLRIKHDRTRKNRAAQQAV